LPVREAVEVVSVMVAMRALNGGKAGV